MEMERTCTKRIIPEKEECIYTSCYCEENVWKLCEYVLEREEEAINNFYVVFISNQNQTVPLWKQKSGQQEDNLAIWVCTLPKIRPEEDYHVILIFISMEDGVLVYDLDTILDFPCKFESYASQTFRTDFTLRKDFWRMFRVIPAKTFLETFSSDRSKMMKFGLYIKPPPIYPCIRASNGPDNNLDDFISMEPSQSYGEILNFAKFIERFSSR